VPLAAQPARVAPVAGQPASGGPAAPRSVRGVATTCVRGPRGTPLASPARVRPTPAQVLYVVNDLALGGAQRVLLDQAAGLDRRVHEPLVASLELDPAGALVRAFNDAGIQVWRLRRAGEPVAFAVPRLVTLLERTRPAVVHTHLAAAGVAGRIAARAVTRARVVSTLHNLSDWQERAWHPLRRLDRASLGRADAIVAVSDAVRMAFVRRCPTLAATTLTIRNGVDVRAFATTPAMHAAARARFGYGPDEVVVGVVARLERRKGVDVLVRALARARGTTRALRLHVVGDGPERDALESLARAHGIVRAVRFAGRDPDVRSHLAAFDLFAAPSRSEGLGLALIEALAAGVPALGASVGGIPELLAGAACARLLPPGDEAAWTAALLELASDHVTRAVMAREAPAWAGRFSLDASVRSLEALYGRLLSAAVPGAAGEDASASTARAA
jgi:glycosyltransferase involved in cell wall biosynthesis